VPDRATVHEMRSLSYSTPRIPCSNFKKRHGVTLASHLLFLQEHSCLLQETRKNICNELMYAKLDLEIMKDSLQVIRGDLQVNLVLFSEDLRKVFNTFVRFCPFKFLKYPISENVIKRNAMHVRTREYQRKFCNSKISKIWDENVQLVKAKQNFLLFEKKTRNIQFIQKGKVN